MRDWARDSSSARFVSPLEASSWAAFQRWYASLRAVVASSRAAEAASWFACAKVSGRHGLHEEGLYLDLNHGRFEADNVIVELLVCIPPVLYLALLCRKSMVEFSYALRCLVFLGEQQRLTLLERAVYGEMLVHDVGDGKKCKGLCKAVRVGVERTAKNAPPEHRERQKPQQTGRRAGGWR